MECDDDGGVGGDRCCYLVGEEDAVWLLRLVLPYVNEVLLNLRSLFSGEPSTTMKVGESQRKAPCVCSCEYFRQKNERKKKHCTIWYVVPGIDAHLWICTTDM